MKVGIPREVKNNEFRVAITPAGVHELVRNGHQVFVEQNAGVGSSITDAEYVSAGAEILGSADEVWAIADLLLKVKEPIAEEYHRLRKDQTLFTYLHLAASRECTDALLESGTTAIAYETVELANRALPLLAPMSEVAGRLAPQVGAYHLMRSAGGRGVLPGGVPGHFDPQGALSVGLGVNPMELDLTVYNLLMERGMSADEVLLKTAVPNMDLLPSNIDLSAAEVQLVSEVARESTLQRALKPLLADYDYIVIDCQPSLGLLTVNALTAAHKVIVPLECEFFALRGVALLTETIEKVQERLNPELELDGILATMYDSRTVHSREVLARVVEAFDDHVYHTVIGRTVRFPETTVAGEPITTYASNSVGAAAYRQLAREVLARCHAE
ncbi:hypothetical protein SAVIM40S_01929 [Streptomyces avidinii]